MKNLSYLVFLLFFGYTAAQQSIIFQPEYQPESVYESISEIKMITHSDIKGDQAVRENLKQGGLELPMYSEGLTSIKTTTNTFKRENDRIPFKIYYDDISITQIINGEIEEVDDPLKGMTAYGYYTGYIVTIDSLQSNKGISEFQASLISSLQDSMNSIKYPEGEMKIGDVFVQEIPMSMAFPGMEGFHLSQKVEYKLVEVKNDTAFFDVTADIEVPSYNLEGLEMEASGDGSGTMEYDLRNKLFSRSQTSFQTNMKIKSPEIEFIMNMEMEINMLDTLKK